MENPLNHPVLQIGWKRAESLPLIFEYILFAFVIEKRHEDHPSCSKEILNHSATETVTAKTRLYHITLV